MFQLVLSDQLREHLGAVAQDADSPKQPKVFDSMTSRMFMTPGA